MNFKNVIKIGISLLKSEKQRLNFILLIFIYFSSLSLHGQAGFKRDQLRYSRVKAAFLEKKQWLDSLQSKNAEFKILIQVFKEEKTLEVWFKNPDGYDKELEYSFCSSSGTLGPKRKEGDYQIPEGVYSINIFNPASNFHLSLGLNYPNKSDRILGDPSTPGSDIYIHGSCVTIGCIPITDDKIMELYVLAVEAKERGQLKIPVYIFPNRMNEENYSVLIQKSENQSTQRLWEDLKNIYRYIDKARDIPDIHISNEGRYLIIKG